MENLWEAISRAPWWVYPLFIYLVLIGIQSIKPRTMSIKRVVLLPVLFTAWALYGLYIKLTLGLVSLIPLWVVCLAIGAYLGVREVHTWRISVDRHRGEVTIPGNYSTLVLIFLIFFLRFFWSYFYATHADISYWVYFSDVLTSSLITGFFVGRAVFFFNSYRKWS